MSTIGWVCVPFIRLDSEKRNFRRNLIDDVHDYRPQVPRSQRHFLAMIISDNQRSRPSVVRMCEGFAINSGDPKCVPPFGGQKNTKIQNLQMSLSLF